MTTSKASSKSEKKSKKIDSINDKKANIIRSRPSEEDIREKANEIYLQRIERDEYGTPENDWILAEKLLTDSEV